MSRPFLVARSSSASVVHDGAFHSLTVPLARFPSTTDVADRLRRLSVATWPDARPAQLWTEDASAARAEAHRPLAPGRLVRATLLRGADGGGELVLVADRAHLDAESLRHVADVLLGDRPVETAVAGSGAAEAPARDDLDADLVDPFGRVPGAAGDHVLHATLAPVVGDVTAVVVAALAVVLGRYGRSALPVVAGLVRSHDGSRADRPVLVEVPVDDDLATREVVRSVARALANPASGCDQATYDRLVARRHGRVVAGVVDGGVARPGDRVVPVLSAPFPLTLCPVTVDGTTTLTLVARREDLDEDSAATFLETFVHVHAQVAGGDLSVGQVSTAGTTDTADAVVPQEPGTSLPDAFARVVASSPHAVALTDGDTSLTYAELERRAERAADVLVGAGVRPGDRVGICLERSADVVTTMLAVLKASAVYVPMDPAYPDDRLAYVIEDAGLRVVVSTRTDLPAPDGVLVVDPALLADRPAPTRPSRAVAGEDPAYVIYTSGSTGRPKGVVVAHRSVTALVAATREDLALGADDTWTLFHSTAFDFSVWEIWGPLLTGARLVVVPYWASRDPEELWRLLQRERVTVLNQTPSAFDQLIEADGRTGSSRLDLRLVVFGGEALDARRLLPWFDRYPESTCRLVNMYGITETTVHVTAQDVTRDAALTGSRSVGRAIRGWSVCVRDEHLRPVPTGMPGEILVGGDGLAIEYLGRPELTAERFVADPVTGRRLYRSGDLGRLRPDGTLDHLGRIDTQVKIRGFRIELDEVRAVIEDVPGVVSCAVVVGGDVERDAASARLDAYLVLDGTDTETVRQRIGRLLPSFMVPATLTPVPELLLTRNGKLDVRALPDPLETPRARPVTTAPRAQPVTTAPVDALEPLRAAWESTLGVPVAVDDNFFELGGNSLLAVRLAATMRDGGLPTLPLRSLYLHPTVSRLAQALASEGAR